MLEKPLAVRLGEFVAALTFEDFRQQSWIRPRRLKRIARRQGHQKAIVAVARHLLPGGPRAHDELLIRPRALSGPTLRCIRCEGQLSPSKRIGE